MKTILGFSAAAILIITGCGESTSTTGSSVSSHRAEVEAAIEKAQREGKSDAEAFRAGEVALEKAMKK
jgi:hypothetical protein